VQSCICAVSFTLLQKLSFSGRAVLFIRPVPAVVASVTAPHVRDAAITVGTLEASLRTGTTGRAVLFVRPVPAVVASVTVPHVRDAAITVGTLEASRRAGDARDST